ncbi:MAG: hypothetical protein JSS81_27070, partial [Acidobacteria bacterium]|nr:hypothetical protein [Acidobacteriota bacterium]
MKITLSTSLMELHKYEIKGLGAANARKLALAVAAFAYKNEPAEATVEDLLNYFPMRYEDRSNFIGIDRLVAETEASVELFVRVSGGFKVGKSRSPKAPPLYIFEITAGDAERTRKPVVVWWFVSGKQAHRVIGYYQSRFRRGTRFVAYGKWEWDGRRNTYSLRLSKPDELEILPNLEDAETYGLLRGLPGESAAEPPPPAGGSDDDWLEDTENPEFAMIHSGRHVPVYRKLGPFQTKRLRELVYSVLERLDPASVTEILPPEMVARQRLISRLDALREIHFPPESASLVEYAAARSNAHRRLIFEEFFWVSFALQLKRGERTQEPKGSLIEIGPKTFERIEKLLPFTLTGAQERVVDRIFDDMQSNAPMNRLVQGDVGSGKT